MPEDADSEHLQDLEAHADAEPTVEDDTGEEMRPAGEVEALEEAEGPTKRIDEDLEGDEETEDISDVEAGDG